MYKHRLSAGGVYFMSKKSNNTKSNNQHILANSIEPDYYLGCDIAKYKIDISLINNVGRELWNDVMLNDQEALLEALLTITGAYTESTVRIVVEATGTYHFALAEVCYDLGIQCYIYNPIITRGGIKATIRGKKTDRSDALLIAKMGLRGEGNPYQPESHKQIKYYARAHTKLGQYGSSFRLFENHISSVIEDEITDESKACLINIRDAINKARVQLFEDMLKSDKSEDFKLLQSIKGIGPFTAYNIVGEVQDIHKFSSVDKFIAYSGFDPKIIQSGKVLNSTGKLTKRGSTHLRRSIFIAANVARIRDPQFKALYEKKRSEGKTHKQATCVVARKLLRVVYSVWKNNKAYSLPAVA